MTKEELEKLKYALNTYGGGIGTTDALKLIADIERLQSEREWRPIETVPDEVKKDGKEILCWAGGFYKNYAVCYWHEDDDEFVDGMWLTDFKGKGHYQIVDATHWMPLPSAPEGGKE